MFYNIKETESIEEEITSETLVFDIIKTKLGISENVIFESVHRMGSEFPRNGDRRIRPIVAKFSEFKMKEKVRKIRLDWRLLTLVLLNNFHPKFKQRERNCDQS